jgi:anti-sigma-K factor RskA
MARLGRRTPPAQDDPALVALGDRLTRLPADAWHEPAPPPLRVDLGGAAGGRPRGLTLRPLVAGLAAAVLLAAGIGVGALLAGGGRSMPRAAVGRRAERVDLTAVGPVSRSARGTARIVPGRPGHMVVRVSGLPASRAGYYELWLMSSGTDLVSLGSFAVSASGRAAIDVPVPLDPARFKYVDISAEPADGNPAHSSKSVLRGPVS